MRRSIVWTAILALSWTQGIWAAGNTWNKIRYKGGTIQARVDPYDFNTTLSVTYDWIVVAVAHSKPVRFKPAQVESISYGPEAYRRVAEVAALGMRATPPPLFGLLRKSKVDFIGIVYHTEDGKSGGVLLETLAWWSILNVLKDITGKPIETSK